MPEHSASAARRTTRLTVSLPASLVDEVDRFLADGTSRSAAARVALERAVAEERRRQEVERFVRGYEADPQTEEEFGWADAAVLDFWSQHPSPEHEREGEPIDVCEPWGDPGSWTPIESEAALADILPPGDR